MMRTSTQPISTFSLLVLLLALAPAQLYAATAQDYFNNANRLLRQGDYAGAGPYYQAAIKLDPGHWMAWQGLGNCYVKLGQPGNAIKAYEKALAISPGNPPLARYLEKLKADSAAPKPTPKPLVREERKPLAQKQWDKTKQFVNEILLGKRFYLDAKGTKKRPSVKKVYRWTAPASISIIKSDKKQRQALQQVIDDVNAMLAGSGMQLNQLEDGESSADILIYFGTGHDFDLLAEKYDLQEKNRPKRFHIETRQAGDAAEIKSAFIFMSDEMGLGYIEHNCNVVLCVVLGFSGASNLNLAGSIMCSGGWRSNRDIPDKLGPLDKKLLHFLYAFPNPGCEKEELEDLFEQYWPEPN